MKTPALPPTPPPDPAALRAQLRSLPPEVLRTLIAGAIAPQRNDAPAPDGSKLLSVPGPAGRVLSFRLSADDWNL